MALPGDAHRLAVVDPRRDVDTDRAAPRAPSAAATVGAGHLGNRAAADAAPARRRAHELPERRAHDLADHAGPVAFAAGQHLGALGRAVALALLAGGDELEIEVDVRAGCGVGEVDLDGRLGIGAGLGTARAGEAAAEERAEQVVQEREVHEALGMEALTGHCLVPVAVVARPPVVVGQHLVGLCDLAEALLGVRRLGDVRMQLPGKPAEGLLDLAVRRLAADAQQFVVVLLGHVDQNSTSCRNSNPLPEAEE
jgi:hypothetical protein